MVVHGFGERSQLGFAELRLGMRLARNDCMGGCTGTLAAPDRDSTVADLGGASSRPESGNECQAPSSLGKTPAERGSKLDERRGHLSPMMVGEDRLENRVGFTLPEIG